MSKDPNSYTLDEKTRICLEASSGDEKSLQDTLDKYEIDGETLKRWMQETGIRADTDSGSDPSSSSPYETVTVDMDDETAESTRFGASYDRLNYKRLTFWAFFGSAVILVMILSIIFIYEFSFSGMNDRQSVQNNYVDIQELQTKDAERLGSFGIVDLDNGIYHVPVDSVINQMTSTAK